MPGMGSDRGGKVTVELTPYDLSRARKRFRANGLARANSFRREL